MSAVRRFIRKPRARSNAGIRRSRTASCWKITSCRASLNARSMPSSSITTTAATTRASATLRQPTPTSAEPQLSSNNEKGSNDRQSNSGACSTASSPLNINPKIEADTPLIQPDRCAKCYDDGQLQDCSFQDSDD